MAHLNPFTNTNLFLWIITVMYLANAISNIITPNWRMVVYCIGAIILQLAVLSMNAMK